MLSLLCLLIFSIAPDSPRVLSQVDAAENVGAQVSDESEFLAGLSTASHKEEFDLYEYVKNASCIPGQDIFERLEYAMRALLNHWYSFDKQPQIKLSALLKTESISRRISKLIRIFCFAIDECYFGNKVRLTEEACENFVFTLQERHPNFISSKASLRINEMRKAVEADLADEED